MQIYTVFYQMLHTLTNPLWDWYTKQVKEVLTPQDGLKEPVRSAADDAWQRDGQFRGLVAVLIDPAALSAMGLHDDMPQALPHSDVEAAKLDEAAAAAFTLTGHLRMHRSWTLSKASVLADCYAPILTNEMRLPRIACGQMRKDWKYFTKLQCLAQNHDDHNAAGAR